MKKVKITVLKKHFDKELAAEYGAEGLGACPMLREGQVFYADYAKPEGFCDEAWKAIYSMSLLWRTARGKKFFITATGLENPAWQFAAATTVCVR